MACKIEGCLGIGFKRADGSRTFTKGYCIKHYRRLLVHGDPNVIKHITGKNRPKHKLYSTYMNMYVRCYREHNKNFADYGGRGITIDESWLGDNGFEQFVTDMGERPHGTTLDRKNNNKGYSKDNCKWSSSYVQAANRRNSNKKVGVCFITRLKKYEAYIYVKTKNIVLGHFANWEDAVSARIEAEKKYTDIFIDLQ